MTTQPTETIVETRQRGYRVVEGWLRENRGITFPEGAIDDLNYRVGIAITAALALQPEAERRINPNDVGKIATALGFFASCIKSGEAWTWHCEVALRQSHEALTKITSHSEAERAKIIEECAKVAGGEEQHQKSECARARSVHAKLKAVQVATDPA